MHIDEKDYEALVKMAEYGVTAMKASVIREDLIKKATVELADVGLLRKEESDSMERILANSPEAAFTSLSVAVGKLKEAQLSKVEPKPTVMEVPILGSLVKKRKSAAYDGSSLDAASKAMVRVWGYNV